MKATAIEENVFFFIHAYGRMFEMFDNLVLPSLWCTQPVVLSVEA